MARILVVEDEPSMRELLEIMLRKAGHAATLLGDVPAAMQTLEAEPFDVVVTDLRLGQRSGLEVLACARATTPPTEVILMTAFATPENELQAKASGAFSYVRKPFKLEDLGLVVQRAIERRALLQENEALRRRLEERSAFHRILGASPAIAEMRTLIQTKVGPTKATVLVTGPSGVGKELVARAVHDCSPRAANPFVAVNCGAMPEGLIEMELFGSEKGAFTGATNAKVGLFRAAEGGTLFLDEIGELPQAVQVKLLRAIQERTIRPVGGTQDLDVDVRLVAATNRDLAAEVAAGKFREDLYYRLNVIGLAVPALRERREDILVLAAAFLRRVAEEQGRAVPKFTAAAEEALVAHAWPGNVRELENVIERAVTLADGDELGVEVLPLSLRGAPPQSRPVTPVPGPLVLPPGFDLEAHLEREERRLLALAIARANGVKTEAAKLLGLSFRSLRYRLAKLSMEEGGPGEA